jgi:hypothetical protein
LAIITGMAPWGALRTVLVLSERPDPWAFLRDRLDPELVSVAWAQPATCAVALAETVPWTIAGNGTQPAPDLSQLEGKLFVCRWVGPAPDGLPVRPLVCRDWQAMSADLERALARSLRGVRLAPGAGLLLADGSFVSRVGELEVLLGAHPAGIQVAGSARSAARRVNALINRLGLPFRVRRTGDTIALAENHR